MIEEKMIEEKGLTKMEKIGILMIEYNTLRSALIQRNQSAFQLLGVTWTASVAIVAFIALQNICIAIPTFMVFLVSVWIAWRAIDFISTHNTERLCELEKAVNELAGDRLLAWESDYGTKMRKKWLRNPFSVLQPYHPSTEQEE